MKAGKFTFLKIIGYILLTFGAIFLMVGFGSIFDSSNPHSNDAMLGGFMMGLPTTIAGIASILFVYKKEKKSLTIFHEELIYIVAKEKKGIINPVDISLKGKITREESKKILDDCVSKGIASAEVNENGFVEYMFPEFLE